MCSGLLGQVTINAVLFDDDLLHIFDYYVAGAQQKWYALVHVCQRWRKIVFGSPHRLNLRIFCTSSTPVRKQLDDWPALPIVISADSYEQYYKQDNIIAALERNERVSQINIPIMRFSIYGSNVLAALEKPFPVLTDLTLRLTEYRDPIIIFTDREKFLGGSTRLWSLYYLSCRFQNYRSYSSLSLTLSTFALITFLLWVNFHPKRLSLACPR